MAEKESIIYEFTMDTTEAVKNIENAKQKISELRNAEKELNEERENGNVTAEEYTQRLADLRVAQEQQKIVVKANTDVLKANAKQMASNKGSLEQMRGELKRLQVEYDNLSDTERKSAKGEEMRKKLEGLNNEIKGVEMSTGRFGRNVGNYLNSIKSAFADAGGAAGRMAGGVAGITTKVKALIAVPIIAVLNGIVFVVQKVVGALKSSEETFNRVRVAMAGFQGISDIVTRALQKLGEGIAWVVEKLATLASKLKGVSDAQSKRVELTKQQIALEKREREIIVENSELLLESERMRQKATAKDVYTDEQRLVFLQKAKDLELQIANNNIELAKKRYAIIRDTNALTESSTEDLKEESMAQAAINEAQQAYESRLKELNSQIVEAKNAIKVKNQASKDGAEIDIEAMKASIDYNKKFKDATESIMESLQGISAEGGDALNEYVNEVGEQLGLAGEYWENYLQVVEDEAEEEKAIQQDKALAIGSIFGSLSTLTAKFGEKNEALAKASKVLAVAQVAIEGGVAIARATADGAKLGIPGIIATVATATTNLAIAIASIASAKFATGGYVQGAGTSTSDSIPARLSNGESVITAKATKMFYPLLSAINVAGGGVPFGNEGARNKFATGGVISYNALASGRSSSEVAEVLEAIKQVQPVVSVREITKVSNRVKVKESR